MIDKQTKIRDLARGITAHDEVNEGGWLAAWAIEKFGEEGAKAFFRRRALIRAMMAHELEQTLGGEET